MRRRRPAPRRRRRRSAGGPGPPPRRRGGVGAVLPQPLRRTAQGRPGLRVRTGRRRRRPGDLRRRRGRAARRPARSLRPPRLRLPLAQTAAVTDADGVRRFYDDLAEDYERVYADWAASSRRQAQALDALLPANALMLDCAAGIGTQLLGLAALGHRVAGTDLSVVALRRAAERNPDVGVAAADMRALPFAEAAFDAVVCADNALPHLLTAPDVRRALAEMLRVVVPGGVVLVDPRLRRAPPDPARGDARERPPRHRRRHRRLPAVDLASGRRALRPRSSSRDRRRRRVAGARPALHLLGDAA